MTSANKKKNRKYGPLLTGDPRPGEIGKPMLAFKNIMYGAMADFTEDIRWVIVQRLRTKGMEEAALFLEQEDVSEWSKASIQRSYEERDKHTKKALAENTTGLK